MKVRERAVKWSLSILTMGVLLLLLLLLIRFPRISRQKPPLLEMTVILREDGNSAGIYLRQGMEQAAADLNVELRFLLPTPPGDEKEQRQLLRWEVENGAAAILLFPADRGALAEEVRAGAGSAALVTLETDMTKEGAGGYAGVDNAALGQAVAKAALNGVREGETALLIHSVPGDTGVEERFSAAQDLLLSQGRQVRSFTLLPGEPPETLLSCLEEEPVQALLAFESAALERVSDRLASLESPPLLYGVGSTAQVMAGLEQGSITAAVAQNDFSVGYLAVEQAACLARRKAPAERGELSFFTVRKENISDPEYQKLLFPVTR